MDELEEALKKKDEDMKQMEERYKKYLEKAKSVSACSRLTVTIVTSHRHEQTCPLQVIRTLDPKQNQGSGPEVQALKNQLQEKERMLLSMEVTDVWDRNLLTDPLSSRFRPSLFPKNMRLHQVLRSDQRSRLCSPPNRRRWTRPKVKGITRRR